MKVAILGGTGFMGYDFVRTLLESETAAPVVYCTSAKSLVNLARHDVDIRLIPPARLANEVLDSHTDFLVNFAHPFDVRDGLTPDRQIGNLCRFIRTNLLRNTDLKLIHVSSMSVYEPFAPETRFSEDAALHPPKTDTYARAKLRIERELEAIPNAIGRLSILRPTIVYGPFCRAWTDALLDAFRAGDVQYDDLGGRVQPIYVRDVSRFVNDRLNDFKSGVYNLGGPSVVSWKEFLDFFADIAGGGKLVHNPEAGKAEARSGWKKMKDSAAAYVGDVRKLVQVCAREPSFNNLVSPITHRLPMGLRTKVHGLFGIDSRGGASTSPAAPTRRAPGPYCARFFAEDRLVSTERSIRIAENLRWTRLAKTADNLTEYARFRFTDEMLT